MKIVAPLLETLSLIGVGINGDGYAIKKAKGKPKCNNFKLSIKEGTIFDNTRLGIYLVLLLVWHFVHNMSIKQTQSFMDIGGHNNNTVVDWFSFCHEVCDDWMKKKSEKLGGPGGVVEIDESYMCGKW